MLKRCLAVHPRAHPRAGLRAVEPESRHARAARSGAGVLNEYEDISRSLSGRFFIGWSVLTSMRRPSALTSDPMRASGVPPCPHDPDGCDPRRRRHDPGTDHMAPMPLNTSRPSERRRKSSLLDRTAGSRHGSSCVARRPAWPRSWSASPTLRHHGDERRRLRQPHREVRVRRQAEDQTGRRRCWISPISTHRRAHVPRVHGGR